MIGSRALRIEDPVLLRGRGRFAADITRQGELHMRVVRSPVAHGRISEVDVTNARLAEGVRAVWTHADVEDLPAIGFRLTPRPELLPYRQPVLAREYVRYVGEPVAAIFATTAGQAEDAAELLQLDIERLPAHLDADLPPVEWIGANLATWAAGTGEKVPAQKSEATTFTEKYGDVDDAFRKGKSAVAAGTHRIVTIDVHIGRHTGVPLECRGLVAWFDEAREQLLIGGAAKVPFWNRDAIAAAVGLPPQQVIVQETHVGGGFGPRGELYPEDVLVAVAAMRLRSPVKWIEDRQEHLVATNHSRGQHHRLRALVRARDGWIEALDGSFTLDQGAYVRTHGATVASLTASMLPGPYVIPNFRVQAHVRLTNKTPAGTYRSPGRYEGTFARERLIDAIARELGLDSTAVRRTNFVPPDQMPYERPIQAMGTALIHDSGNYELLLEKVSSRFDFSGIRSKVQRRRASGELAGFGIAYFVEKSGIGPAEGARVSVDTSGHVTISCGASSVGQGVDTVLAQIAGDVLSVPYEQITVTRGRTDQFPYGRGAFATRLSVMAGSAVARASEALGEKAIRVAAHHLKITTEQLELRDGTISRTDQAGTALTLGDLARLLDPANAEQLKEDPGLTADGWFHTDHMTYPYGLHAAQVGIDPGTGQVRVERYIIGYDVGRALNPTLVEGQLAGGAAQGIGGALYEEFRYAADGAPLCTTFMDYLIPTLHEIPEVETLVTEDAPSPINPLGVKGAGEGGITAAAAAIASAVDDAIGGTEPIRAVPIRPELLRRIIQSQPRPAAPSQHATPIVTSRANPARARRSTRHATQE